jgi:hypothetical protein
MTDLEPNALATSLGSNLAEHLTAMDDAKLLSLWSSVMTELRSRSVLRSSNNPTGDYAEYLVAAQLGLQLVPPSTKSYDAVAPDGKRFQIKGRRLTRTNASRQLGVLRKLDQDSFDYLVVVMFGSNFELQEMWQLPIDLVREHATFNKYQNAHILHARGEMLNDPRAVRLDRPQTKAS